MTVARSPSFISAEAGKDSKGAMAMGSLRKEGEVMSMYTFPQEKPVERSRKDKAQKKIPEYFFMILLIDPTA
jgi:hypothetical protein